MLYYNNIDQCPLSVFRLVSDTGDYKQLLISGEYNEYEAVKAWMLLYDEYNGAVNSGANNVLFGLKKQAYILSLQYQIVHNCLFAINELNNCNLINMEQVHNLDYFIKTINEHGYKFEVEKGILKEVERVSKQLNNKRSQIESINKRIESLTKGNNGKYVDTITNVEASLGFQINEQTTTVAKFVSYLNQIS